jgi:hypothetical protein
MTTQETADAVARAFQACAEIRCPKCGVEPWQHCRNRIAGVLVNARFHKPRQVAAGAPAILAPVGIGHLRWQPAVSGKWTGARVT